MSGRYLLTPQPEVGQHGPAWLRWVDHYAHTHAAAVETISVQDFPPMVRAHITQEEGETATDTNFKLVTTMMGRIGSVHGLRQVPMTLEDAVTMTEALVLDKVLGTLRQDAIIGAYHIDDPQLGRASPLGAALKYWLDAVLGAPPAAPAAEG